MATITSGNYKYLATLTMPTALIEQTIAFTSNDVTYTSVRVTTDTMYYVNGSTETEVYNTSSKWTTEDTNCQNIKLSEAQEVDSTFVAWFNNNTTKQTLKYIQVGELGKAILVTNKDALPTAGVLFLNKFYVTADTKMVYTCVLEGGSYVWKVSTILPTLTNGITESTQLKEGIEAIDADGNKITGTLKLIDKTIVQNGTYYPNDDDAQGYNTVTVNIAGETAENPYVATTKDELEAYLAAEYTGSFIRFENARYRDISLPKTLYTPGSGYTQSFDYELGQIRMNKYIDYWIPGTGLQMLLTASCANPWQLIHQSTTITWTDDNYCHVYAYKYRNSDGSYCRALIGTIHNTKTQDTYVSSDFTAMLMYIDGYIANDTVLPTITDDFTGSTKTDTPSYTASAVDVLGWYQNGSAYGDQYVPSGNDGYETMSLAITPNTSSTGTNTISYIYKNAMLLCARLLGTSAGSVIEQESVQKYCDLGIYEVKATVTVNSTWNAESPLAVGDALAGATVYFNTNLTYDDVIALNNAIIPEADYNTQLEVVGFFNCDNPIEYSESAPLPAYKMLFGLFVYRPGTPGGGYSALGSMSYLVDDSPAIMLLTAEGWQVTSLQFLSEYTAMGITQDATITKINYPTFLNQVVGKTANFTKSTETVTEYSLELTLTAGEILEIAQTSALTSFSKNTNNIGKIVRSTDDSTTLYTKGALYIVTED